MCYLLHLFAGRVNTMDTIYQTSIMMPPLHQLNSRLRLLNPLQQQTIQKKMKEHHPINPLQISA